MSSQPSVRALAWAGFAALAVAMGIGRFAFTPLLPMMQEDLHLGLAQGGWLASANYLGYFAGAITAAYLPWRATTLLLIGLLSVVATTALMGVTTTWSTWIAWRSIAGIASAWVLVAAASLCLARLSEAGTPHKSGVVFSGVGGGIALSGLVCMVMGLRGFTAAQAWMTLAAVAAGGFIATRPLWAGSVRPSASRGEPPPRNDRHTHWRLILCYGFFGFGYILPATFLPAQARDLLNDAALFGWAWPLFGTAAALSTLASSALLRYVPRRLLWLLSQLLMAVGVVIPAVSPGLPSIVVAAVCVGGTFMVITMLGMQQAQVSGGRRVRALMGNLTAAFAAGQLAGPVFFSLIYDYFGGSLNLALYVAATALIVGCALLLKPFPVHGDASED